MISIETMEAEEYSKIFKSIVEYLKITPNKFATQMGVTPQSISNVYNGKTRPSAQLLSKIKEIYPQINSDFLLSGYQSVRMVFPPPCDSEN